ncbi:hypothetical protein [Mucilaginibacter pedocola]|nr:hypothetical protein [Mucilaginibacter pedocola]
MNTSSTIVARVFHKQTTGFFHVYTPFEFAFVIAFFAEFYNTKIRNMLYVLIAAFAIFCVLNTVYLESMMQLDGNARSVDAIILIACCMLFFAKNNNDLDSRWADHASNWITAGLLLYYSCSLFMFIFFNKMTEAGIMSDIIIYIYATILAIEYILFAVGFNKCRAQQAISISK